MVYNIMNHFILAKINDINKSLPVCTGQLSIWGLPDAFSIFSQPLIKKSCWMREPRFGYLSVKHNKENRDVDA